MILWYLVNRPKEMTYIDIKQEEKEITKIIEKPFVNLYPTSIVKDEELGNLSIPRLKRKIPIFEGTEESELKKGVGHFIESAMPGENNNSVISGHRETYFRGLDKIKIGNLLIVETSAGIFTYQVCEIKIVYADDKTVIVYTDHAVLTLTTCYPFEYAFKAPKRYIISADLISEDIKKLV